MRVSLVIDVLGSLLRVTDVDDVEARAWGRCAVAAPSSASDVMGSSDGGEVSAVIEVAGGAGARQLELAVVRQAITSAVGRAHLWHAAAVSTADGRVLAMVAPSRTGKTTAALHLASNGFGYVTDETVGVTLDGRVLPFCKPLSIRSPGRPKDIVGPDELGLATCPDFLRLSRVVVLDRAESGERPSVSPLPLATAVVLLSGQSSGLARLPSPLAAICALVDQIGGVDRLTYREIDAATPLLTDLLASPHRTPEPWIHLPPTSSAAPEDQDREFGALRRAPYVDAVRVGSQVLVMRETSIIRLDGVGASMWCSLERPRGQSEVLALMRALHGPHPDDARLVADAVDALIAGSAVAVVGDTSA